MCVRLLIYKFIYILFLFRVFVVAAAASGVVRLRLVTSRGPPHPSRSGPTRLAASGIKTLASSGGIGRGMGDPAT